MEKIKIGDHVICQTEISGIVVGFYIPTACEEQTKVRTADGRLYHAPTSWWRPYKDGLQPNLTIYDELLTIEREVKFKQVAINMIPNIDLLNEAVMKSIAKDIVQNLANIQTDKMVNR